MLVNRNLDHGVGSKRFKLMKGDQCPQELVKELDSMGYLMSDLEANAWNAKVSAKAAQDKADKAASAASSEKNKSKGAVAPENK